MTDKMILENATVKDNTVSDIKELNLITDCSQ